MRRSRVLKNRLRERVLVTLRSGETFDGLLHDFDDKCLVLVQASTPGVEGPVKADGSVLVPWENVVYVQKP